MSTLRTIQFGALAVSVLLFAGCGGGSEPNEQLNEVRLEVTRPPVAREMAQPGSPQGHGHIERWAAVRSVMEGEPPEQPPEGSLTREEILKLADRVFQLNDISTAYHELLAIHFSDWQLGLPPRTAPYDCYIDRVFKQGTLRMTLTDADKNGRVSAGDSAEYLADACGSPRNSVALDGRAWVSILSVSGTNLYADGSYWAIRSRQRHESFLAYDHYKSQGHATGSLETFRERAPGRDVYSLEFDQWTFRDVHFPQEPFTLQSGKIVVNYHAGADNGTNFQNLQFETVLPIGQGRPVRTVLNSLAPLITPVGGVTGVVLAEVGADRIKFSWASRKLVIEVDYGADGTVDLEINP